MNSKGVDDLGMRMRIENRLGDRFINARVDGAHDDRFVVWDPREARARGLGYPLGFEEGEKCSEVSDVFGWFSSAGREGADFLVLGIGPIRDGGIDGLPLIFDPVIGVAGWGVESPD